MSEYSTDGNESGVPTEATVPPLGAVLRAARESRGESLSEVAMALKLSVRQLEAMEQERFADLPGPAFVKGFVRNYGRHLGVDVEPMIAARWGVPAATSIELTPMTNAEGTLPVSGTPSRISRVLAPLLLILLLGGGLAWYFDGFDPHPAAPEAEPAAALAPDETPQPEAEGYPPPLAEGSEEAAVEPPPAAAELTPVPPAPVTEPESQPAPAAPTVAAETPAAPAAGDVQAAAPSAAESAADLASGPGRLVFRLDQESWLEVRDSRDRRLYSGVGSAGSVRVVQGQRPFSIVVGNAAGVRLEHAGSEIDLAPHTSSGGVARLQVD